MAIIQFMALIFRSRVCVVPHRNTRTRNTVTPSFRNTEHQNIKLIPLNLLKIRGEKITRGCEIIAGKIIP